MMYEASGISPIITTDDHRNEFCQPVCHHCGWVGETLPADDIGYFSQTITHVHVRDIDEAVED